MIRLRMADSNGVATSTCLSQYKTFISLRKDLGNEKKSNELTNCKYKYKYEQHNANVM